MSSVVTQDSDYSPEYQDAYQRLWHEAAADRDRYKNAIKEALDHWPGEAHRGAAYYALLDALSTDSNQDTRDS